MKYLCLVYLDETNPDKCPDSECLAYDSAIRRSGHCLASEALESVETATTVRMRNGRMSVTDGPFAETKEQLAGFYMVEAKDLNEAIQLAAKIPPARLGSIEVRPVRPIREMNTPAEVDLLQASGSRLGSRFDSGSETCNPKSEA